MEFCNSFPCRCKKRCKFVTCVCGNKIPYHESACSPECYEKIKTPERPPFSIISFLMEEFELEQMQEPEGSFIEVLWDRMDSSHRGNALEYLREWGRGWRSE